MTQNDEPISKVFTETKGASCFPIDFYRNRWFFAP